MYHCALENRTVSSCAQPTLVVTHQLQVERRTGKVRQSETDVLPLCHRVDHGSGPSAGRVTSF